MNKLSIYEFMSYFLPGVLACFILQQFIPENGYILKSSSAFSSGLVFSIVAIVIGLCLHNFTHYLLFSLKVKWLSKYLREPVAKIAKKNQYIQESYSYALENHNTEQLKGSDLFHKAYFFLEYHGKITSAKGFQSMYIFLKNLVILSLILLPLLVICVAINFCTTIAIFFILLCLLSIAPLTLSSRFYRKKMIEFVFNTYAMGIEQELKNEEKTSK